MCKVEGQQFIVAAFPPFLHYKKCNHDYSRMKASLLKHKIKTLSLFLMLASLTSCGHSGGVPIPFGEAEIDLDSIVARGYIRVVSDYNSVNYFIHKGVEVGYQYELLREYAKHLGVSLQIVADNELESGYTKLESGDVDVLASTLVADTMLLPPVSLCEPYGRGRIVVVGRGGHSPDSESPLSSLEGDTVSVMAHSFYSEAIKRVAHSADLDIHVNEIKHYDAEQLVGLVAEGEVKMTLCLESMAKANMWYYDQLQIGPAISDELDLAWGVRLSSPNLRADISQWMRTFKKTSKFKRIYRKYVIDPREHHSASQSVSADTYIPVYEHLIKRVAVDPRYDWVLISSMVYQESHFNPSARSWAGALGLLQLMPETGLRFGADDLSDPIQNLSAGYDYLIWLDKRLAINVPNPKERVKFVIAAYNVGLGHVMDAIRLAQKFGKNGQVWSGNVETAILLKSNPAYYSDPVVKHGFCRATETVAYVKSVLDRYHNYCKALL